MNTAHRQPYVVSDWPDEPALSPSQFATRADYEAALIQYENARVVAAVNEYHACTADVCKSGRLACPFPDACLVSEDDLPRAVRWAAKFIAWLRS